LYWKIIVSRETFLKLSFKEYAVNFDFSNFFKRYEKIKVQADQVFESVKVQYSDCVKCKLECSDCCYALFDLTLIEALYLKFNFDNVLSEGRNAQIVKIANKVDRTIYKLKKNAYKALKLGTPESEILAKLAEERVACPLLDSNNHCELYEHRPITCRLYGIPLSIAGEGHTCGLSEFKTGEPYNTVNLDAFQNKLIELSKELVRELQSKYVKMGDLLVPVSMALLTTYDESFLGIPAKKDTHETEGK
jgi:Fe-S-cluster containining protein